MLVQLSCFRIGSTSLHSNFIWTWLSPRNHFWCQKPKTLGYLMVKTPPHHLSAFPRFDTIPDFDGQTDGRLRRSIYSACKASFAERCNKNTEPVVRMAAIAWTYDANE